VKRKISNYKSLPYNKALKSKAASLRKAGNLSEALLWLQLKNKQFKGFDFDRQKIIGNFIVDFFCVDNGVVIEVDGDSHDEKYEYDCRRETFLQDLGLTIIHILDIDVKKNIEGVMLMLEKHSAFVKNDHPVTCGDTPPQRGIFP